MQIKVTEISATFYVINHASMPIHIRPIKKKINKVKYVFFI